jgi:hypothetical protein
VYRSAAASLALSAANRCCDAALLLDALQQLVV